MSIVSDGITANDVADWQNKLKHRSPISYRIVDGRGRSVGEYRIAYRGSSGWPLSNRWVLTSIQIDPAFQWQGWLRRTWEKLIAEYPGIQPEPPLSWESWQFFASRPEVDMSLMFVA